MVKTLILLEEPEKINHIIQDSARIKGEIVNISLSPGASYAFEKSDISYKSIRNYGSSEERYQQGLENFQRIDRLTTILDKELSHLYSTPTLTPARFSIYNLKILFDVLWTTIHILKRIIDTEQPDFIRLYAPPNIKSVERLYAYSNDESVYAEVLKMPGWNVPIEIIRETDSDIPDNETMDQKNTRVIRWLAWIKESDLFFNLGLIGKREGFGSSAKALYYHVTCRHRKHVLIYNNGYNWDDSLAKLYMSGVVPVYRIWDETINKAISNDNNNQEEVRSVCNMHPGMREFDQIFGITVTIFFFERLSQIIGRSIQESITAYPLARKKIHQKKIRCLLHSVRERAIGHAIVQAAHDEGIPVVSWQHGGAGYCYHPMMPFIEFINSDWHFVFGEGVAQSYRSTSENAGLEKIPIFVSVGSSSLDTFHRKEKKSIENPAKKTVVYISTSYLRNVYTISQPFDPADWDEHLWFIQKQILDLAKRNPEKEFIIKLHPVHKNKEPLLSYVTDCGIKNVKIISSEMTVRELTDIADVMIFDLISTGILQVLTSNLPIFVYAGLHSIDSNPLSELKKRAFVYNNIQEFKENIQNFLNGKQDSINPVNSLNTDFLKKYGTDIKIHNSAGKAITKLKEIISGNEF